METNVFAKFLAVLLVLAFAVASSAWLIKPDPSMAFAAVLDEMIKDPEFQERLVQSVDRVGDIQKAKYSQSAEMFRNPWQLFEVFEGPEATKFVVRSSTKVMSEYSTDFQRAFELFQIAVLIALFATLCALLGALRSFWSGAGYVPESEFPSAETVKKIVGDLRARASSQRNQAALILLTIASACFTSFLLFYTAEDLISSRFDRSMDSLENSMYQLNEEVGELSEQIQEAVSTFTDFEQADEQDIRTVELALQSLTTMLNSSKFSELSAIPAQSMIVVQEGKNTVLTTLLVRIGSITIAIFIVLMLAPAYRHSISLASFYDSRADSLTLVSLDDRGQLEAILGLMNPPIHHPENKTARRLRALLEKGAEDDEP